MNIKNIVGIFFAGFIVFSVTAYSVYVIYTKDNNTKNLTTNISEVENNKVTIEEDVDKVEEINDIKEEEVYKTNFDTNLIFKYNYVDEDYNKIEKKPININMAGLTIEELDKIYEDWEISYYNEKEICLEKDIKTIDENKYVVSIDNGYVTVFQNIEGELQTYIKTDRKVEELYENDMLLLTNGIKVNSDSELLKILEDFES